MEQLLGSSEFDGADYRDESGEFFEPYTVNASLLLHESTPVVFWQIH